MTPRPLTYAICADCGGRFCVDMEPRCWRETAELDAFGAPVEEAVCYDCQELEWLERTGRYNSVVAT